jgi:hypothetical protein
MNCEQWTAKAYQVVFVFPTVAKSKPFVLTDKQAFQDLTTTHAIDTQLKRACILTLRPLYSWWIQSCWSLYMRLGLLGPVSRTIKTVTWFEIPDRNAAHAALSRRSSGLQFHSTALGHFEYFGYPLSLSFHEYSIPVNSLITDAILLRKWPRRANKISDILINYAASGGYLLTTDRENPSVPFFLTCENESIGYSETS